MLQLFIVFFINIFLFYVVYKKSLYKKDFLFFYIFFILFAVLIPLIYQGENQIFLNQIEMKGDARYYLFGAFHILSDGTPQTYHPFYEYFLAFFLYKSNIFYAMIAQSFFYVFIYILTVSLINKFCVSKKGFFLLSYFLLFNFLCWGTFATTMRDSINLFIFFLIFYSFINLYIKFRFFYLFLILISIYFLIDLQLNSIFIIIIIIAFTFSVLKKYYLNFNKKYFNLLILLIGLLIFILSFKYMDWFINEIILNYIEHKRFEEEIALGSHIDNNPIKNIVRFLFGPGLIRPLFPDIFFMKFTWSNSIFYWLGEISWYIFFLITFPLIIRKPFHFLKVHPVLISLLLFFLFYSFSYAFAGSGLGMRKRMIVHFFYALFIVIVYFTKKNYNELIIYKYPKLVNFAGIKLSYNTYIMLILIFYALITYKGIYI